MKYAVCAVFDKAVGAYMRPAFAQSVGQMVRSFGDEVNRPDQNNPINGHPDDFELFHFGFFDDDTGRFELSDIPARVARASDLFVQK